MQSHYRGFIIEWREPPVTPTRWVMSVTAADAGLRNLIEDEPHIIDAPTRAAGFASACAFIDGLLGR